MRLADRIVAFFDRINDVLVFVAGVILIFIVASVSAEVIFRYFLNAPFTWVVEVNENNLLYITFLAVAAGLLNKQVAAELDTTERTIKFHRAHIMQKAHAESLADLVRMVEKMGIKADVP